MFVFLMLLNKIYYKHQLTKKIDFYIYLNYI